MHDHRLSALVLTVSDLDRSIAFYRDVLGLGLSALDDVTASKLRVDYALDGVTIALGLNQSDTSAPTGSPGAMWHLCFAVPRLDPVVERLRKAGAAFAVEPRAARGGVRICFFFDPDGVLLELTEGGLSYDTDYRKAHSPPIAEGETIRIDHVAVDVTDRSAAADAYRKTLGFELLGELDYSEDNFGITYMNDGKFGIELFQFDQGNPGSIIDDSQRWRFALAASLSEGGHCDGVADTVLSRDGTVKFGRIARSTSDCASVKAKGLQ